MKLIQEQFCVKISEICHSRESGNPVKWSIPMDSRFRENDVVGKF